MESKIKGYDFVDAIYWIIANKGVAILPEYDRIQPLMGCHIFQATHRQLHNDDGLKNIRLCTTIQKNIPIIMAAIESQREYGAGWIDFIDSTSHSKQSIDHFSPSWLRAADIPGMLISEPYKDLSESSRKTLCL
jgi:hypothetical protein